MLRERTLPSAETKAPSAELDRQSTSTFDVTRPIEGDEAMLYKNGMAEPTIIQLESSEEERKAPWTYTLSRPTHGRRY